MQNQGELAVAGVYVRVFNEQPNFTLADPAAFCKARSSALQRDIAATSLRLCYQTLRYLPRSWFSNSILKKNCW